jgi:formylglycine-generating enzyme required for sulfatase activity
MRPFFIFLALGFLVPALALAQSTGRQVPSGMVLVEGGTFPMGSTSGDPDERPVHPVTVSSFLLDLNEVTVAEYRAFCVATGRSMPPAPAWGWNDNHPIVRVTWRNAKAYAEYVGKRLPTEAEWEYAARGGRFAHGYVYSGSNTAWDVAWDSLDAPAQTHPVAQKQPNELHLYDMSGNASEWVSDWYDANYYTVSVGTNPQGPASGALRAKKGGSWQWGPNSARVTDRSGFWETDSLLDLGFRCAGTPPSAPPVPGPTSPTNGAPGTSTNLTLTWNASSGATYYRVQLSTSAAFDTVSFDSSGITGTSLLIQWLSGATTYYWRVFAASSVNESDPSAAWSFTTLTGPYLGYRIPIPGIVEAEYYDAGGEGVSYHDSSTVNQGAVEGTWFRTAEGVDLEKTQDPEGGGYDVGWTTGVEWMRYSVTVAKSGPYRMDARVASRVPMRFHLEMDESPITGIFANDGTGGWQIWATLSDTVTLTAGDHFLYVKMDPKTGGGDDGNYNLFRFTDLGVPPPAAPTGLTATAVSASQIDLSWTDASNNESGFRIERKVGGTSSYIDIDSVGPNATGYQNKGLAASTRYVFRIRSYNISGFSQYSDTASATTQSKSITVTSPLGGATWIVRGQQQVTWTSLNVTGTVKVLLSTDGGSSFPLTLGTATVGAGAANVTVPDVASADCRVRVESSSDGAIFGLNPGAFAVAAPKITVTGPIAGAIWQVASKQQITWTGAYVTGNVTLRLSTDGGGTYPVTLGSALVSAGTASLTVPDNQSSTCRIKVESASDTSVFGENPGNFNIVPYVPAQISVTEPGAGANWVVGSSHQVTWSCQGLTGNVSILLSTDGGNLYSIALGTAAANAGSKTVVVPENVSTTCRVKVQSADSLNVFGLNPGNFTISSRPVPLITVVSPSAGASWIVGSSQLVTWTSQYLGGTARIVLSSDGGGSYPMTLGTTSVLADSLTITVPDNPSATCRVAVESIDSVGVRGVSSSNFSIVDSAVAAISVTGPTAGEKWIVGSQQVIHWTSRHVAGDVTITLSTDGGGTYPYTLNTAMAGSGEVTVSVPNALSSTCRVKVASVSNATVYGLNPGNFSIVPIVRTLTVTSKNPATGVAVAVTPADINGGADGETQFIRQYNSSTNVTLLAASTAGGNLFKKWQRGGVDFGTSTSVSVLMDADYTVTAVYEVPVPPSPSALEATNVTQNSFDAVWTAVSGATSYALDVSSDDFTSFQSGYATRDVGIGPKWQVTGLNSGTIYKYRVYAVNAGGRSLLPSNIITVRTYVPSYSLSQIVSFPSHGSLTEYARADYQLVGFPGNSGKDLGSFLSGQQKDAWQAYWDNGQTSNYYVEYQQGSSTFAVSTGKGFWILNKGSWTLSGIATPATIDTNGVAVIDLTPVRKYYLITNPFDVTISWSGVLTANNLTSPSSTVIWSYDQKWNSATDMVPYKGYLFDNAAAKSELRIPYRLTLPGAVSKGVAASEGWKIAVAVRAGKLEDRTTWFGVLPGSKNGMDDYEQNKPRHISGAPDAFFEHPEWNRDYPEFATDLRPSVADLEVWSMKLRSDARNSLVLTFDGVSAVPEELSVYLLDENAGRSVDLRKQPVYTTAAFVGTRTVNVLVGKEEAIKAKIDAMLPHEFALLPNYPNPFNPTTTISVVVPKRERVALEIFNSLGQRVIRLVHDDLDAGIHQIEWQGKNESGAMVASGVYYCVMRTASGFRTARGLVLMK